MTTWKERMRDAYREYTRRTSPGFYELSGGARMKTKNWTDKTANGLTACITDWIKFHGGFASRINNTGMMRRLGGQMRWTKGTSANGLADIMGTLHGRSLNIEVKIGKDRMSDAQKKVQAQVEASGGLYFVAKDMDMFLEWFDGVFSNVAA